MNLKAQRAAALKAAQDIIASAEKHGRSLTAGEISQVEAKHAEIADLDKQIKEAMEQSQLIKAIGDLEEDHEESEAPVQKSKSLGEHFIKNLGGRSLKEPGTIVVPEFKAAGDTHEVGDAYGPLVTDVDRDPALPKRERLVVADLFGTGTVSGNSITYPVFGALEGGTGAVAEGGTKPQMHVADPDWVTDRLGEIAGHFKLTDDMAEDIPYIVSEINSTALYDLAYKEEQAILNGDGVNPNLRGIMNRNGVQTHALGSDNAPDAIFKAMSKVSLATGFEADGIVINPADYEAIRLSKDSNGQYFGGGYFTGQYGNGDIVVHPPLWGRRTVVTSAIEAGTVLVGNFASAKVFRKGGIRVESTNSHADDFINDKITVRVRSRLGLQVKYPAAFVKVTLGE